MNNIKKFLLEKRISRLEKYFIHEARPANNFASKDDIIKYIKSNKVLYDEIFPYLWDATDNNWPIPDKIRYVFKPGSGKNSWKLQVNSRDFEPLLNFLTNNGFAQTGTSSDRTVIFSNDDISIAIRPTTSTGAPDSKLPTVVTTEISEQATLIAIMNNYTTASSADLIKEELLDYIYVNYPNYTESITLQRLLPNYIESAWKSASVFLSTVNINPSSYEGERRGYLSEPIYAVAKHLGFSGRDDSWNPADIFLYISEDTPDTFVDNFIKKYEDLGVAPTLSDYNAALYDEILAKRIFPISLKQNSSNPKVTLPKLNSDETATNKIPDNLLIDNIKLAVSSIDNPDYDGTKKSARKISSGIISGLALDIKNYDKIVKAHIKSGDNVSYEVASAAGAKYQDGGIDTVNVLRPFVFDGLNSLKPIYSELYDNENPANIKKINNLIDSIFNCGFPIYIGSKRTSPDELKSMYLYNGPGKRDVIMKYASAIVNLYYITKNLTKNGKQSESSLLKKLLASGSKADDLQGPFYKIS